MRLANRRVGAPAPGGVGRSLGSVTRSPGDRFRRLGTVLYAGIVLGFVLLRVFSVPPWDQSVDAYAYWATRDGDYYAGAMVGRLGSYVYPPTFAQALGAVSWLPWPLFNAFWTALNCVALFVLAGPWALAALLFLPIPFEIVSGNIHLLIAIAIAAGFRWPATWAFVLVTKATAGVGLLWFVTRREWKVLGLAGGTALVLATASFLLAPEAWGQWFRLIEAGGVAPDTPGWRLDVPLPIRLVVAGAIVVWGARTDRRWTVALAATIALPVLWLNGLAVAAAALPDLRRGRVAPSLGVLRWWGRS